MNTLTTVSVKGPWRPSHDEVLVKLKRQALINLWLQVASHRHYVTLNNWLIVPSIVITTGLSLGIWGIDNTVPGKYILSACALIGGVLTALSKQVAAAEKSSEYQLRGKEYVIVIRDIDFLLAIDRDQRPDTEKAMTGIRTTLDRIVDQQLSPPRSVMHQFEKRFKNIEASLMGIDWHNMTCDSGIAPGLSLALEQPHINRNVIMTPFQFYNRGVQTVTPTSGQVTRGSDFSDDLV